MKLAVSIKGGLDRYFHILCFNPWFAAARVAKKSNRNVQNWFVDSPLTSGIKIALNIFFFS